MVGADRVDDGYDKISRRSEIVMDRTRVWAEFFPSVFWDDSLREDNVDARLRISPSRAFADRAQEPVP
jgi:hypothetical protein